MALENATRPFDTASPIYMRSGEGRQLRVITDLVTIKATERETGDCYALFERETPPNGGCPAHTQRYEDETFYVLEGTYSFLIGEEVTELGPGGYAFVPRGTVHGYTNVGDSPARLLVFVTPGGVQEQFIDEVGDDAERPTWEPNMAKVLAVAPKYGVEFATPDIDDEPAGPA